MAPNKGRLSAPSLEFLQKAGFSLPADSRSYKSTLGGSTVLFARARDIPYYVASGFSDFGITGRDIVVESCQQVFEICELPFGECAVVLASGGSILNVRDLEGKRVATEFPVIAKNFLESRAVAAEIIRLDGATELAVSCGLADAVIDITSTGRTLRENGLFVRDFVMASNAVLIASERSVSKSDGLLALAREKGGLG